MFSVSLGFTGHFINKAKIGSNFREATVQIIFRFLLLAATLCSTVDAVEPYTPHHSNPLLEPWRWRSFPKIGGQELQCLAEDRDGNLWFGTQDGIWRYDGLEWTRFGVNQGLDGTPVVAIVVSPSNTIFCASGLASMPSRKRVDPNLPVDG